MPPTPYALLTEIDRPPSLYFKLTKGTMFEPWVYRAMEDHYYFNKPVNIWERHDSLPTRIARASHIGVCIGALTGWVYGYFDNMARGYKGVDNFKHMGTYRMASMGMLTGLIQSTAFTLTVSGLSYLNGREDTALDWYFGGLAMGVVTVAMSQAKAVINSPKMNKIAIVGWPCTPFIMKYLNYMNEYDDPKGGRFAMQVGGTLHHSVAEMRALYGIEPAQVPLEKLMNRTSTPDSSYLRPRQNPKWNDKFRVEEE